MSADKKDTEYKFSPRPEAHATHWEDLLSPVQHAIRDLLLRIEGANRQATEINISRAENRSGPVAANCFLVYGDRGTGKTTVLINAKEASERPDAFFGEGKDDGAWREAKRAAGNLRDVKWLDVLDLEPLPPRANLLTTVLTRVRNALHWSGSKASIDETKSILEEGADSARQQLNHLINDATLMWEDIQESDTRGRANRQVAAADIYAQFQRRFWDAMESLSLELGRQRGIDNLNCPMVLPIDNIDRSTEHLYSIVKLAQMVSCPRLWLVMAGDRQDVETFLERAYWKELIRIGEEGAGATGKTGVGGEDEALVMARRQAAAASHKLLPPSHRVEVKLVPPMETLAFPPPGLSDRSEGAKNIRRLLTDICLITEKEVQHCVELAGESEKGAGVNESQTTTEQRIEPFAVEDRTGIRLIDLFDAKSRIGNAIRSNDSEDTDSYLTEAAEVGLRLPARAVLDLYQLASWVSTDDTVKKHRKAEKLARTMLRNVISESSMSSEVGRHLQEEIIRRTHQEGTILDFEDPKIGGEGVLKVGRLMALDFELPKVLWGSRAAGYMARSSLDVMRVKALVLRLMYRQPGRKEYSESGRIDENYELVLLPDLVAAWLTILHDTLVWGAEDSDIIGIGGVELRPAGIVRCRHELVVESGAEETKQKMAAHSEQIWQIPAWQSFNAHDVFWQMWRAFLSDFENAGLSDRVNDTYPPRLLAAGWVACVIETFVAYGRLWNWDGPSEVLASLRKMILAGRFNKKIVKRAETETFKAAAKVYLEAAKGSHLRVNRAHEVRRVMRYWLEWELPFLLSSLFVPLPDRDDKTRTEEVIETISDTELAKQWKTNWLYILADVERKMRKMIEGREELNEPPPPFDDLSRIFPEDEKSGGP